jgi:hypothetical protein
LLNGLRARLRSILEPLFDPSLRTGNEFVVRTVIFGEALRFRIFPMTFPVFGSMMRTSLAGPADWIAMSVFHDKYFQTICFYRPFC